MSRRWMAIGAGIVVIGAALYGWGYRWSPLAAAAVMAGGHTREYGRVRYSWGEVVLLETPNGPRTELVQGKGLVWRDTANVVFNPIKPGPIHTIGWISAGNVKGQATVIAVAVSSPTVAFVVAGPSGSRQRLPVTEGKPLIFSWNRSIPATDLNLVALSKTGTTLFRYAMQENRNTYGAVTSTGQFHWTPVHTAT